jgi:glycosyltransferase involved in cell wall biosynthesis
MPLSKLSEGSIRRWRRMIDGPASPRRPLGRSGVPPFSGTGGVAAETDLAEASRALNREQPSSAEPGVKKRRAVLFLIPSLTGGGAERVIVTLLRHLDRERFTLALAVVDMRNAVYRSDVPDDVEVIDLGSSRVRYALPRIIRLIWRRRPDVAFSTLGHLNLALAILRPLLPNETRYVARETVVVSQALGSYSLPVIWAAAYRLFYHRFDLVICQSADMQRDLVTTFRLPSQRAVVIHNPVDVSRIHDLANERQAGPGGIGPARPDRAKTHLVAAGRLVHQKGFDILIEAVALCRNPSLQLTILGEGPLHEELERLAQEKGVAEQVQFSGFLRNPYPTLALADAFVLSSRYEGFPNVVLEALACGTPVVATPAPGGTREILEGVNGCFVAANISAEALAVALTRLVKGYRVPESVVEPYGVRSITRAYEDVLS